VSAVVGAVVSDPPGRLGRGVSARVCQRDVSMGSIRDELRRFERRRLRPLFRRFKRRRDDQPAAIPLPAADVRVGDDHEELLVALVRAELRRRTAGDAAEPLALSSAGGGGEAERLVRSLLASGDGPAAGAAPRSEAA
jgi:hypothetical protein